MRTGRRAFGLAGLALAGVFAAGSAGAQDRDQPQPPAVYQAVIDCDAIAEAAERLACFDRSVAALKAATRAREVVVVDRGTVREARRGLFGLSLPRIKLFGNDDDTEEVTAIDSTIASVRMAPDRMPIFVLADGARWKQTEGRNVFAKAGQPIHIKRGALGSYVANVNKQPGVRVVRLAQ
jgi:hypothetical protein